MLLVSEANNLITTEKNCHSYLHKRNMISLQNNRDNFPKMRFSDCVKKNIPKKAENTETPTSRIMTNLFQEDCHQHSVSENEEEDPKSEKDSSSDEEEQRIRSNPNYMSKVDYALRLGYDEAHLMTVLKKLGPEAEQNDVLLAELVKLFASTKVSEEPEFVSSLPPESALQNKVSSPTPEDDGDNLRMIVIDGSNVAMQHGNREVFSCKGIKYAVDYFKQRGHQKIVVFVPLWRKESPRKDAPITDQEILTELEKERILVFTPARTIKGRRVACYDDRYILKVANELDGIVVSNDNYRDLLNENEGFRKVIEERLLMYSFMEDKFMPPDDPLGRHGPSLDNFLRKTPTAPEPLPPNCPYGKKCTYGNKCKYHHPERGNMPHKTVTEKLAERYKPMIQEVKDRAIAEVEKNKTDKKSKAKSPLNRTKSIILKDDDTGELPNTTRDLKPNEVRQPMDDYNEKLTKLAMNIKLCESSLQENFCNSNNNNNNNNNHNNNNNNNNNIGPDLSGMRQHCSTSSLPTRFQPSPPEPLVIGHLQVAKKLSDDANKDAEKKSMSSNTARNCMYANNGQYSPLKHSPHNTTQHQHLKVSRQLGIYSEEDPRIKRSPNTINGSHVHFWNDLAVDPRHKNMRQVISYPEPESYQQNQSSLVFTPMIPPLHQMQNTPEKFISYPPSSLARQQSYPWVQVPIMEQYNPINVNPPHPVYSMSSNHDQIYSSGVYEPVLPNSGPGTPVSFANSIPRASYIDPNQYPFSPTQLSPTMLNCFQVHQTTSHHCPQQNLTHSPTHCVSPPTSVMTPNQSGLSAHVQNTEIYQKLCGLFPEKVVLEVLKQYPNETDPVVLCRHLVSSQSTESPEERALSM